MSWCLCGGRYITPSHKRIRPWYSAAKTVCWPEENNSPLLLTLTLSKKYQALGGHAKRDVGVHLHRAGSLQRREPDHPRLEGGARDQVRVLTMAIILVRLQNSVLCFASPCSVPVLHFSDTPSFTPTPTHQPTAVLHIIPQLQAWR